MRVFLALWILIISAVAATAQNATVIGPITPGDCALFNSTTILKDAGFNCNGFLSVVTVSTNTVLTTSNYTVLCNATGSTITITLPAATSNQIINISKSDASANSCIASGSIDGASSFTLTHQYENLQLQWNGASWTIL